VYTEEGDFDPSFNCLIYPALTELDGRLAKVALLGTAERNAILVGTAASLLEAIRRKVSRLLVLELNAARVSGSLAAEDSAGRWTEFLQRSSQESYWYSLAEHYPTLMPRLEKVIGGRLVAAAELGRRFATNRGRFGALGEEFAAADQELLRVSFGEGDSHRGGRSVALVEVSAGTIVYKPRSLGVDRALDRFLENLFGTLSQAERIRVPAVLPCGTYGWSEFVRHRYCESPAELRAYYTRLGHWLALARLFGTTDLHAENLIACGPVPVVIDCETLFTPNQVVKPQGLGDAVDRAAALLAGTVLSSGLLPGRSTGLGWRGADISAGGALPGEQPDMQAPRIVDAGTDLARLAMGPVPPLAALNIPAPAPDLGRYWPDLLQGFEELTQRLQDLDRAGSLAGSLGVFADVDIRAVLRSTEIYAELGRMLWHPVSLHDEPAAVRHACDLLAKQAEFAAAAPSDPAVIAGEVADLLDGDIPFFTTTPTAGWLRGPRDTSWGEQHDVLAAALGRWRAADLPVEREVIQASLVCAYINDGFMSDVPRLPAVRPVANDLDRRRQRLAAEIVQRLVSTAIRGDDGTATWIAPVLNVTGWSVQPLSPDGYSGAPGVALLLAGYQGEVRAGRATPVAGVAELLAATVAGMRATEQYRTARRRAGDQLRPEPPGRYVGLGSQIWCWLQLGSSGAVSPEEALHHALSIAELLPEALAEATESDLLSGRAGAIVTLLDLARRTQDGRWCDLAIGAGERLVELSLLDAGRARWPSELQPAGLGGFGHGATGIGWALALLADATGRTDFAALAEAAFGYEETLWDPAGGSWRDAREESGVATAWCHGATGIGLASADLIARRLTGNTDHLSTVRRAAEACWSLGMGWNHTVCHGDLGCWELLHRAFLLDAGPAGLDEQAVTAAIVSSIEAHGPVSGLARAAFCPGLMPGLGGVAYQLLRMDPRSDLPSLLLPS